MVSGGCELRGDKRLRRQVYRAVMGHILAKFFYNPNKEKLVATK
jgi:hypothetical protein